MPAIRLRQGLGVGRRGVRINPFRKPPYVRPDPLSIGAAMWFDPFTQQVITGGKCSSWTDRVTGISLLQSDATLRPVAASQSEAGGVPGLVFSGTGSTYMSSSSMPELTQPYTVFMVAAAREAGRQQTLTKTLGTGGGSAGELGLAQDTGSPRWRLFAGGTYNGGSNPAVLGARTAVVGRFNGSASLLASNGRFSAAGGAGVRRAAGQMHFGWDPATATNGNRAFNGIIWEWGWFNKALSTEEMAILDSHLQDRYALSPKVTDYIEPPTQADLGAFGTGPFGTTPFGGTG